MQIAVDVVVEKAAHGQRPEAHGRTHKQEILGQMATFQQSESVGAFAVFDSLPFEARADDKRN
jgi:hypothetical protein